MVKDPTKFRKRFALWKSGKKVYNAGKPISGEEYELFHSTLPDNQRLASESEYSTRRYWELNGKPKNFDEAVKKGMYTRLSDGWHAGSIAWTPEGDAEFMKPNVHPTKHFEDEYYESNKEFLKKYRRTLDWTRPGFSKYERNINPLDHINLPHYDTGTPDGEAGENGRTLLKSNTVTGTPVYPIFDKDKVYNRMLANADHYPAFDPFGISTTISAMMHYMANDDDTVDNNIKRSKETIRHVQNRDLHFKKLAKRNGIFDKKGLDNLANNLLAYHNNLLGLEDAKDIYLGMPQRSGTFSPADKQPSNGTLTNPYKSNYLSNDKYIIDRYLLPAYRNILNGNISGKKYTDKDWKAGDILELGKSGRNGVTFLPILGNATVGAGYDKDKGPYVSYYDTWDIDMTGNSNTEDKLVSKVLDGKPFDIYDRIYLDDYYGLDAPSHSQYLPEVTVSAQKFDKGKSIHNPRLEKISRSSRKNWNIFQKSGRDVFI